MIIKSNPISSDSNSLGLYNYFCTNDKNEDIEIIKADMQDVENCFQDAERFNRKNSIRHFQLSSKEKLTNEQFKDLLEKLKEEFNLTDDDIIMTSIHSYKNESSDRDPRHMHVAVRLVNPENGKVKSFDNLYQRQEKIARMFEVYNGLELVKGRHNRAVYENVPDEYKEKLFHLTQGQLPNSFLRDGQYQKQQRNGMNSFEIRNKCKELLKQCDSLQAFSNAIAEHGWSLEQGTKKIILNDKDGNLVGSVDRILGMKKEEFEAFKGDFEVPLKEVASPIMRSTSSYDNKLAKAVPVEPSEKPSEPSEQPKATTEPKSQEQHQEQAPKADLGGPAVLSESVKGVATESMSQAEKQAVHDENRRQQELDEAVKKQASEQKRFADFLNEIADDVDRKIRNKKNFDEFIKLEISENEKILNEKHPTLKHLDKKEIRSFLYKNFKNELADLKEQKEKLFTLRKQIREHDKNDGIFKIYHSYKSTSKKKIEKEANTQVKLKASFIIDNMKYKLGLSKTEPKEENYLSAHQRHTRASNAMKDEYKNLLASYESNVRAINAIAELKFMQRENKLHDFYNRPEVTEARDYIMKLERVRDLSIDDMTDNEKDKYDLYIEKCDIEGMNKLIYEKNKRILEEERKKDKENSLSHDENNDEFVDDREIEKNIYRKKKNTLSR